MPACPNLSIHPWKHIDAVFGRDAVYLLASIFESPQFQAWKGDSKFPHVDNDFIIYSNNGQSVNVIDILAKHGPKLAYKKIKAYVPGAVIGSEISTVLKNIIDRTGSSDRRDLAEKLLEKANLVQGVKVILNTPEVSVSASEEGFHESLDMREEYFTGLYEYHEDGRMARILLQPSLFNNNQGDIERIILHEILHAFTSEVFVAPDKTEVDQKFVDDIYSLFEITKGVMRKNGIDPSKHYGMRNSQEFIAEIMTSPEFRETIQELSDRGIWNRFLNIIRRWLGMTTDPASALYNRSINTIVDYISGLERVPTSKDGGRNFFSIKPDESTVALDRKANTFERIFRTLNRRITDLGRTPNKDNDKFRRETQALLKQLEQAEDDRIITLAVKNAKETVNRLYKEFENAYNTNTLSFSLLEKVVRISNGIDYLDDLHTLIRRDVKLKEKHKDLLDEISKIQQTILEINRNYDELSAPAMATRLSKYDFRVEREVQNELEKEFGPRDVQKYPTEEEYRQAKAEFVSLHMEMQRGEIERRKQKRITEELRVGAKDVSRLSSFLRGFQDIGDDVIAMAKQLLDRATDRIRERYNPIEREIKSILDDLRKVKKTSNVQKLYEDILEKDSKGKLTGFYISEFRTGEFEQVNQAFLDSLEDMSPKERAKAWQDFMRENYEQEFSEEWQRQVDALTASKSDEYYEIKSKINDLLRPFKDPNGGLFFDEVPDDIWADIKELETQLSALRGKSAKELFEIAQFIPTEEWERVNKLKQDELSEEDYQEWFALQHREVEVRGTVIQQLLPQWTNMVPADPKHFNPRWDGTRKLKHEKWANPQFTALMKLPEDHPSRRLYNYVIGLQQKFDALRPQDRQLGFRIPTMRKTVVEKIGSGDVSYTSMREQFDQAFRIQEDDVEYGEQAGEDEITLPDDAEGRIHRSVPIFFTGKIPVDEMSFDIATITARNAFFSLNYEEKFKVLPELETLRRTLERREVVRHDPLGRKILTPSGNASTLRGDETQVYKAYINLLEKELYGIKHKGGRFDKVAERLLGYNSALLMGGNLRASISNLSVGQLMANIHFAVGGEIPHSSWRKAYGLYIKDAHRHVADMGSSDKQSPINILHEVFDGLNDFRGNRYNYVQDGRIKRLSTDGSVFHGLTGTVEHFNQSLALIAILSDIKVLTEDGKFIDAAGNTTDDISKATSLYDAFSYENGKAVLNDKVKKIRFDGRIWDWNPDTRFRITQKVRGINKRINGAYSEQNRGEIYRHVVGRAIMQMRGWLFPQWDKRWRGATSAIKGQATDILDWELQDYYEGYYTSFVRFIRNIIWEQKSLNVFARTHWNELSDLEKRNIGKALAEMAVMLATTGAFMALMEAAKHADDEEDEFFLFHPNFWAYQSVRVRSEFAFFIWAPSMIDIVNDPAASLSTTGDLFEFFAQLFLAPGERYERGKYKGQLKLRKYVDKFVPLWRQLESLPRSQDFINYYNMN